MRNELLILIFCITLIFGFIIFIMIDSSGKYLNSDKAIILKKEFVERKTWFNPATKVIQIDDEHYNYLIKINDNYTSTSKSDKDIYNVNDEVKVEYKLGKFTNSVYDLNIISIN